MKESWLAEVSFIVFENIYFSAKFARLCFHIYASSGIICAFDTHTASPYTHTRTTIVFSSDVESLQQAQVDSLLSARSRYARTWMSIGVVWCRRIHRNDRCKYTVAAGIYRVFSIATDACCYAARASLSRFRLSSASRTSACLCLCRSTRAVPSRRIPPLLTKKRFSPFLPRDRALTLSPT